MVILPRNLRQYYIFRAQLDPNREILEAAQGDLLATKVYKELHSAINHAKYIVKKGVLFDFHGQVIDISQHGIHLL